MRKKEYQPMTMRGSQMLQQLKNQERQELVKFDTSTPRDVKRTHT